MRIDESGQVCCLIAVAMLWMTPAWTHAQSDESDAPDVEIAEVAPTPPADPAVADALEALAVREAAEQADPSAGSEPPAPKRAAVFVMNRTGENLVDKRGVFEDLLVAELTQHGLALISPQDVQQKVRDFAGVPQGQAMAGDQLDELLENQASALRLAQFLNADYLVIGSLGSLTAEERRIQRPDLGIDRSQHSFRLIGTYKVLGAGLGESLTSDRFVATKTVGETAAVSGIDGETQIDDLLLDAADQIGEAFAAAAPTLRDPDPEGALVSVRIQPTSQDLNVPEVVKDENGQFILTANRFQAQPMSVSVEIDGVTIGSAPGVFEVRPGLHTLRLTREMFEPWERTVAFNDGQVLTVALEMTPEGRQRWLEITEIYERMKNNARNAELMEQLTEGAATMLKQSGFRIDAKELGDSVIQQIK